MRQVVRDGAYAESGRTGVSGFFRLHDKPVDWGSLSVMQASCALLQVLPHVTSNRGHSIT